MREFRGNAEHGLSNLYVIVCGDFCKIGMADDVSSRLRTLQCGNPHDLRLVFEAQVCKKRARECESWAHSLLSEYHHQKEWFRAPIKKAKRAVIDAIARIEDRTQIDWDGLSDGEIEQMYANLINKGSTHTARAQKGAQ